MGIIPLSINDPSKNLFNEFVSQSFQRLLQVDSSGSVYDGTGSLYDVASDSMFGVVIQPSHSFVVGNIIRPTGSANYFVLAQADTAENADVAGIVTSVSTGSFTLTTHGIVKSGVPDYPVGTNLFLSSEVPGVLSTESFAGRVSKPLAIIIESTASMLFNNMRGITMDTSSLNVVMGKNAYQISHGFSLGSVIRVSGLNTYALAKADTTASADVIGLVVEVPNSDNFTFITTGITSVGVPSASFAGDALFLSDEVAGKMTASEPYFVGSVSKPVALVLDDAASMHFFSTMRGIEIGPPFTSSVGLIYTTSSLIGSNSVFSIPTSSYTSLFSNYTINSGSKSRSGRVSSVWNGINLQWVEASTASIGDTTPVTISMALGSGIALSFYTPTANWKIKATADLM